MFHFWRNDYNAVETFVPQIVIYLLLNIFAFDYYRESEFVLAIGKFILALVLIFSTLIAMIGGNPQHLAFGFYNFEGVKDAFPFYLGSDALAFWEA